MRDTAPINMPRSSPMHARFALYGTGLSSRSLTTQQRLRVLSPALRRAHYALGHVQVSALHSKRRTARSPRVRRRGHSSTYTLLRAPPMSRIAREITVIHSPITVQGTSVRICPRRMPSIRSYIQESCAVRGTAPVDTQQAGPARAPAQPRCAVYSAGAVVVVEQQRLSFRSRRPSDFGPSA